MKNLNIFGLILLFTFVGCSGAQKARKEERERLLQSRGVYCDFVSESDYKDVDIELNLRIAKKCDALKPFSITNYKRVSENPGVLYCCNANSSGISSAASSSANKESDDDAKDNKTLSNPSSSK